jgi:hypothetical protein
MSCCVVDCGQVDPETLEARQTRTAKTKTETNLRGVSNGLLRFNSGEMITENVRRSGLF